MKFKAGDVCEIIHTYEELRVFKGKECTVIGFKWIDVEPYYDISVQGSSYPCHIGESCLKLKKPPTKDNTEERFQEFLTKLTNPLSKDEMERLKSEDNVKENV